MSDDLLASLMRLSEGCSVLYVEDEHTIRAEMVEMLETLFPRVVQASNGAEGLEAFGREPFHLVITDINMPVMSGIDFIKTLRLTHPQQGVLVTSAYSDAANLISLINLGVTSFVLKPLNWKTLLNLIHRELSSAHALRQEVLYQKRLEKEVRLRTDELRDAQQQVVRLQEAKDNMLALISHEMRTPLNGILGFIELAKTTELPQEAQAFLSHIEDSALRLEHSTRKALDFAVFSTTGRSIDRKDHHAVDLIRAAHAQVASRTDEVLEVECDPQSAQQKLLTDGELAVEVLKNLFENSVKYAGPRARVRVSVETEGVWDLVIVRDYGPGFSTTLLPGLFQPFSTGNIMHHSEGMGLGLALVDVIMLILGGRVEARNHGGAEVRLHFPRAGSARKTESPRNT